MVLRLYESLGRHTAAFLTPGFEVRGAALTDLLERPAGEDLVRDGRGYVLDFRPFEVKTLRLSR